MPPPHKNTILFLKLANKRRVAGRSRERKASVYRLIRENASLELERLRISRKCCRRYGHQPTNLDGCNLCRRCGEGLRAWNGEPTGHLASIIVMQYGKNWRQQLRGLENARRKVIPTL